MSYRRLGLVVTLFVTAPFSFACSGLSVSDDVGTDGGGIFNPDGSVRIPDDANSSNKNMAYVRLAQLSPLLGAVDFCLRPKGTTYFDGPKLGGNAPAVDASADAGTKKGVSFPNASGYAQVLAAGATDIAIVSAADTSCSSPKLVGTVTIDPNKRMTIAIMGSMKYADAGASALGIEAFIDDTQGHMDSARLRVIHAAVGGPNSNAYGPLAVAVGFANQVDPIAAKVEPRRAATPSSAIPIVDSLGYGSHAPIMGQSSLRFSSLAQMGGPWSTQPADLGLGSNAVKTAFLVNMDPLGFAVVLCGDLPSGGDMPCQLFSAK